MSGITDDQSLLNLATDLGYAGDGHIDRLRPRRDDDAKGLSLSSKYGFNEFPLHTDVAFWKAPARYLVMRSENYSTTPTIILDADATRKLINPCSTEEPIFIINTTRGPIYGGLFFSSDEEDGAGIRFDLNYMKPANPSSQVISNLIENATSEEVKCIEWSGNNALVIDNWACLHGRAAVSESEINRIIHRIYVGGSGA